MRCRIFVAALLLGFTLAAQAADSTSDKQIERGQYLARAADCAACHTAKGGMPYAGGRPIETPFGTVYGTNITPDKESGIGDYSADDFYHVLTEGELPDGTQLYPAMPYPAYHAIPREDSDAMYAYFMSLDGIHAAGPQTDLAWPYSMRWTLNVWNLLFDENSASTKDGNAEQQRGRYLVDTLGHCGACHTPRNFMGANKSDQHLQGAVVGGYLAPNLNADAMAARGWDGASLRIFMREGMSAQGSMYSEMYPVFHHSSRYLNDADLKAMSRYLLGANPPKPTKANVADADGNTPGRRIYLNRCAGCHGANGQGVPHVASAMAGNTTLKLHSPRNLVKVIHDGIDTRTFTGYEQVQAMPGFADTLDDDQIATLATWLHRRWGGQQATVDGATVGKITGSTSE